MYVSGTLKKKTSEFYKPTITLFDEEGIAIKIGSFNYDGELLMTPWEKSSEIKLIKRQEEHIQKGIDKTRFLTNMKYPKLKSEINRMLKIIKETDRKYSFALFEAFYELILASESKQDCLIRIKDFKIFLNWLENQEINQIELELLIKLFLERKNYDKESLQRKKEETFHIKEEELLSESLNEIITFGEFLSPNRVPKIASSLNDIESSKLVLPIYFAISSDLDALKFLKMCRIPDLDEEQVKRNATRMRIPKNIQNLIR